MSYKGLTNDRYYKVLPDIVYMKENMLDPILKGTAENSFFSDLRYTGELWS